MSRKADIAAAFARAAATYDAHAGLQRQTAEALATRIAALDLPAAPHLLEIGCGTGLLTRVLAQRLPSATGLVTDLSPTMVASCRSHLPPGRFSYAAMDGEAPALAGPGFDLVCASLATQWFDDQRAALTRLAALLRPGGWLAVATLGPATLTEWRQAHSKEGVVPPTLDFQEPPEPMCAARGRVAIRHANGRDFLASLRAIGAQTPRPAHNLLPPGTLRRVIARFERDHAATASYEVATLVHRRPV